MAWKDNSFKVLLQDIIDNGYTAKPIRPWKIEGEEVTFKHITHITTSYDISRGEYPITQLLPMDIEAVIKETLWIFQDQSSELKLLRDKYNVTSWDKHNIGDGTIGARYGETIYAYDQMNNLLLDLIQDTVTRQCTLSLYQLTQFEETEGEIPRTLEYMFEVRHDNDKKYLDCCFTQKRSDILNHYHKDLLQALVLQTMLASHIEAEVGILTHFVSNLFLCSIHEKIALRLTRRKVPSTSPKLRLRPKGKSFFDITWEDFILEDYDPVMPAIDIKHVL